MVRPFFGYDEEKIYVHHAFKTYQHNWEEVKKISSLNFIRMTWIYFENGGSLVLGSLITRNYSKVLREFMDVIQEKKVAVDIDGKTLEYSKAKSNLRF